jgi:hypothetical protein
MMADGFLGRWSRRKAGIESDSLEKKVEIPNEPSQALSVEKPAEETPPLPTLEDVAKIDRFDPDFSAFMRSDVDPTVQQAALKKMFTDPHFNVMDGLDIYIDDYSKPDPLPPGMLERMVQSDMLNLFSKTTEVAQEGVKDAGQATDLPLEAGKLEAQQQTDLTSTDQKLSAQLDEVPNQSSIEPEQKKT